MISTVRTTYIIDVKKKTYYKKAVLMKILCRLQHGVVLSDPATRHRGAGMTKMMSIERTHDGRSDAPIAFRIPAEEATNLGWTLADISTKLSRTFWARSISSSEGLAMLAK